MAATKRSNPSNSDHSDGKSSGSTRPRSKPTKENADGVRVVSAVAYLGILFFVPMVAQPKSEFAIFHANQGLLLLITGVVLEIVALILTIVSFGLLFFLPLLVCIYLFVLFVLGLVNALTGKMARLPLIGQRSIIKVQE